MVRIESSLQDKKMFMYMLAVIVMSGYDAIATMQHIGRGVALEGNPLMDSLIQRHALLFFLVKMAVTVTGMLFCYRFAYLRSARLGIKLCAGIYGLLTFYHMLIAVFG